MKHERNNERRRPYETPEIQTIVAKQILDDLGPAVANIYAPPNGF